MAIDEHLQNNCSAATLKNVSFKGGLKILILKLTKLLHSAKIKPGFPLLDWQKNPGLFHDFPEPTWKISQHFFIAHECLNIMAGNTK